MERTAYWNKTVNSRNILIYGQDPHANAIFANLFEIDETKS